jgi:hypothetical protein
MGTEQVFQRLFGVALKTLSGVNGRWTNCSLGSMGKAFV